MGGGAPFCKGLSEWILSRYKDTLAGVIVFVPTARVAARVRAHLAAEMMGVLPAVLPLRGTGELADLLGFEVGSKVDAMAARVEIYEVLKRIEGSGEAAVGMSGERLWRRADGLYKLLDRLALHGIGVKDLRRTVPEHLVGFWEVQAATLLAVGEHMERWLARRNEVLPCAAERMVLEKAAAVLGREDCSWVPVVAGVVDGIPAALEMVKVAAGRGAVVVPELGTVTAELVGILEETLGITCTRLAVSAGVVAEEVAETDWDEAWLAALGVRQAVEEGLGRVAVVSPSKLLLERVSGLLERWGMTVPVTGMLCMDKTVTGRAVLAVETWGLRHGTPAHWLEAMRGSAFADDGFEAVMHALEPLRGIDVWLSHEDWRVVMELRLGEVEAPAMPVTEGVWLMGPLDARLLDFDSVIVAGAVEGVWPALHGDSWLSEAHLRALGMPDMTRRALLAGTEFESAVRSGGAVRVLRARMTEGKEMVPSRFLADVQAQRSDALGGVLKAMRVVEHESEKTGVLGSFRPEGVLWPKRWSASFVEALLACPYKAMGDRVLRLEPLEPITPMPDARTAGLLAHRWLERAGKEITSVTEATAAKAVERLMKLAEMELQRESPVVKAIWRAKFAKLAPALVAQWLADGRAVDVVEKRLAKDVGAVTMTAKLDRVEVAKVAEEPRNQGKVVIDFKTSTPPSWARVASGERPQLALEAWLLQQAGEVVGDVEYWQLKGFGMKPLEVVRPGKKSPLEALMAPVEEGVARLSEAYAEGADFPAVPDMAGGGLMATGHCTWCALAGVCRRKEAAVVP